MAPTKPTKLLRNKKRTSKAAAAAIPAAAKSTITQYLTVTKASASSQNANKPVAAPAEATQTQVSTAAQTSSASSKPTPKKPKIAAYTGKPDPEAEETWPKSKLIASTTITASDARILYRLTSNEIAPLKFTVEPSSNDRPKPMHLYSELEVERTTWRKHGGPARWLWHLDKLRASYKRRHPDGVFKEPSGRNTKPCARCKKRVWDRTMGFDLDPPVCYNCRTKRPGRASPAENDDDVSMEDGPEVEDVENGEEEDPEGEDDESQDDLEK
ncbi:hypothetical protein BV25DRAFT_1992566 [Artomyces pyxidatus]|uniref:Uncharacterized protein n=1 Tax=Artomyces pyxidatus TaxID=48021 RepID=A0ACB8SZ96_9AGAM|nr:hypothetical protein BV25DRAFT_1992566 [Artomyces pyxidatus]